MLRELRCLCTCPPLYGILDPEQTHGRTAEIVLRGMLEAGVTILQLRVKSLAPVDFLDLANAGARGDSIVQLQIDR